jgi:hypothetical protein
MDQMSKTKPAPERQLDPERTKSVQHAAIELAEQLPPELQAGFIADYVRVMTKLNLRLDVELDAFQEEAGPLIAALMPRCPGGVQTALDTHCEAIQGLAGHLVTELSNVPDAAVRALMVQALHRSLDHGAETVNEHETCARRRGGVKLP